MSAPTRPDSPNAPTVQANVVAAVSATGGDHLAAVLDAIQSEDVPGQARRLGTTLLDGLRGRLEDLPGVADVRGLGLMACVECELQQGDNDLDMDAELGSRIDRHCQALGLIVRPLINMCVMSPPLTITRQQIDEMVSILRQGILLAMDDIANEKVAGQGGNRHPSPAA